MARPIRRNPVVRLRRSASQAIRADALDKWLVAMRAGELMRSWRGGLPIYRFHDVLLVATAQVHGHCRLTKRDAVFGAWTGVKLASP